MDQSEREGLWTATTRFGLVKKVVVWEGGVAGGLCYMKACSKFP
jgi:hypothetical protein